MVYDQKKLATGIEDVDMQHRSIIELISKLAKAIEMHTEAAAVKHALQDMMDYSLTHFSNEAGKMKVDGYPERAAHLEEHSVYVELLQEKVGHYMANDGVSAVELIAFLRDWWFNHIQRTDQVWAQWHHAHSPKDANPPK